MASWWSSLLSLVRDPWEGVKAWRERRAKLYEPSKPTFDAYPGLPDEPEMAEYIEARDALGRLLREYVDLKGYGVEHVNFDSTRWRRDFIEAHKSARKVLLARLRLAKIHKERRDKERAEEEFEKAMAREQKGQGIVEFALMLPVLLFTILGGVEAAFLLAEQAHQDRVTFTVAEYAASHPGASWNALANSLLPGCEVAVTKGSFDLTEVTSTCFYEPKVTRGLWDGLPISSQEFASTEPTPEPSP